MDQSKPSPSNRAIESLINLRRQMYDDISHCVSLFENTEADALHNVNLRLLELEEENRQLKEQCSYKQEIINGQEIEIVGLRHQLRSLNRSHGAQIENCDASRAELLSVLQSRLSALPVDTVKDLLRKRPIHETSFTDVSNIQSEKSEVGKPKNKRICMTRNNLVTTTANTGAVQSDPELFGSSDDETSTEKTITAPNKPHDVSGRNVFRMTNLSPPSKAISELPKDIIDHRDLEKYEMSLINSLLSDASDSYQKRNVHGKNCHKHANPKRHRFSYQPRSTPKEKAMPKVHGLLSETERLASDQSRLLDAKKQPVLPHVGDETGVELSEMHSLNDLDTDIDILKSDNGEFKSEPSVKPTLQNSPTDDKVFKKPASRKTLRPINTATTDNQPGVKCVGPVERRQEERRKMQGFTCRECEDFYKNSGLTGPEVKKRLKECSRHRAHHGPPPSTPKGFWDLDISQISTDPESDESDAQNRSGEDRPLLRNRRRRPLEFPAALNKS